MKTKAFVLSAIIVLAALLYAGAPALKRSTSVAKSLSGEISAGTHAIRAENPLGAIAVVGVDHGFGWDWSLECSAGSDAEAQGHIQSYRLDVQQTDDVLQIIVVVPSQHQTSHFSRETIWDRFSWGAQRMGPAGSIRRCDLHIRVPRAVAVDLKNRFGEMKVTGLTAAVNAACEHGNVDLLDIIGKVTLKTSFAKVRMHNVTGDIKLAGKTGAIQVTGVTGDFEAVTSFADVRIDGLDGGARLNCQNGKVEARRVSGDVYANASFGRMQLDGGGRRFRARADNGHVEITARSPRVESIEVSASFAPIDVLLPNGANPIVRASTFFGSVTSDFPVHNVGRADTPPLNVVLRGQNGDIRIRRLAAQ
ncbi:MAG: DUF4097 family beta strand repeat-containing protein [Opitutaceae bacterium]